jgi:hypothetical protein
MRNLVRVTLFIVLLAAIGLIVFLLIFVGPKEKETWATITGLLAVIAAAISAFPALRVLELQDDSSQPRPTPYFDVSSRYNLLQLRVKNIGPNVAYEIRLKWKIHPLDHHGDEITALDYIPSLLPEQTVSTLVGVSTDMVKKYSNMRFEGEAEFKDSNGKSLRQWFVCSTQEHGKRLVHDEELPKTLRELQDIPKQLEKIVDSLNTMSENQRGRTGDDAE